MDLEMPEAARVFEIAYFGPLICGIDVFGYGPYKKQKVRLNERANKVYSRFDPQGKKIMSIYPGVFQVVNQSIGGSLHCSD